MQTRLLEYALIMDKCKSVTKAADEIHISQQALSKALQNLEYELGFPVFERTSRGIVATKEGSVFLEDAQRILSTMHSWKTLAQKKVIVKIGLAHTYSELFTIRDYVNAIPNTPFVAVEWDVVRGGKHILGEVLDNHFQAAFLYTSESKMEEYRDLLNQDDRLILEPLRISRLSVVVPHNSLLGQKENMQLQDLKNLQYVQNYSPSAYPDRLSMEELTGREKLLLPDAVNVLDYIRVREYCFTELPDFIARQLPYVLKGDLRVIPWDDVPERENMHVLLVYRKQNKQVDEYLLPKLKALFQ